MGTVWMEWIKFNKILQKSKFQHPLSSLIHLLTHTTKRTLIPLSQYPSHHSPPNHTCNHKNISRSADPERKKNLLALPRHLHPIPTHQKSPSQDVCKKNFQNTYMLRFISAHYLHPSSPPAGNFCRIQDPVEHGCWSAVQEVDV